MILTSIKAVNDFQVKEWSLYRVMNGVHSAGSRRRLISRGHKKLFVAVKLRPGDVVRRYSRYTSEVICIYTVDIENYHCRYTIDIDIVDALQRLCVDKVNTM